MKAALFGATGKTGTLILRELLATGVTVRALVRDKSRLAPVGNLEIVEGDARAAIDARVAVRGAQVVYCALGMADITKPATDFSTSVATILAAMRAENVSRVLAIASAGVLDHPTGGYRNKEGLPDALRHVSAEHVRNFETLRASAAAWTLLCPVFLKDDIAPGRVRWAFEDLPPGSNETGYADLAHTMIELAGRADAVGKRVGIISVR